MSDELENEELEDEGDAGAIDVEDELLEVRRRLVEADLGEGVGTPQWSAD